MDTKNRRSSLRKSKFSKEDENIALITPRLKRRISFSGRHLVREFHREEEPKAWENSYEISDHVNVDDTTTKICAADKENVPLVLQLKLESNDGQERSNISETVQNGFLSNTRELINTTYQDAILCVENSVDITLLEKEKQCKPVERFSKENAPTNCNSFSLDENEVCNLADFNFTNLGEKTVEFMQDINNGDIKNRHNVKTECASSFCEPKNGTIGGHTTGEISICTNDSLSAIHPENPTSKRETTQSSVTIIVSPETNDYNTEKDNLNPLVSSSTNDTLNSSCTMDLTGYIEVANISANLNKETNEFQVKLDKISFLQHSDDEIIMETETELKSSMQKRQTIGFYRDIESSPLKLKHDCTNSSNYLNEYIKLSPTKTTLSTKRDNIEKIEGISNQATKLVLRKLCTPMSKNSNKTNVFENSIEHYNKKMHEQNPAEVTSVTTARDSPSEQLHENSPSFSLNNFKKVSLSPDSFSKLIPIEYKTYNFKQLNDEIERGKIQLFPKTPTTDRKPKENTHFTRKFAELPKERRTIFFENDISTSLDVTSRNASKPLHSDVFFDFNAEFADPKQNNLVNAKCRFSQADDLMLDNTSFLARAKLGDETTSRNSTKRDLTQLSDIEIVDETIKDTTSQTGSTKPRIKNRKNATSCSFNSMLDDTKQVLNQGNADIKDRFTQNKVCDKGITTEEHIDYPNLKHNSRQTISLNEDMVLSKNEKEEFSFKPEIGIDTPYNKSTVFGTKENITLISVDANKTPFQRNDGMEPEHTSESVSVNHISHKKLMDNSMENDFKSPQQITPPTGQPISHINYDIAMCRNIENYSHTFFNPDVQNNFKVESQRKTIFFGKYGIGNDFPDMCDDTRSKVDVVSKTFDDFKTDNSLTVKLNERVKTTPFTKRVTPNTLYFKNANIEYDKHSREHPIHGSTSNTLFEAGDVETNDPFSKTLHFHYHIPSIRKIDYFTVEDSSHFNAVQYDKHTLNACDIDRHTPESKSTRKTLYFNTEIEETQFCENKPGKKIDLKNNQLIRETVFNNEKQKLNSDISKPEIVSLSTSTLGFRYNTTESESYTNNHIHVLPNYDLENIIDNNMESSLYTEIADIGNCGNLQNLNRKTIFFNENENQADIKCEFFLPLTEKTYQKETLAEVERKTNHLKADKVAFKFLEKEKKGTTMLKSLNNFEVITPRKSLDEFLAYEKRTENEGVTCGDLNYNQCQSPERKETSMKRLPANLTPVSSVAKKKQVLVTPTSKTYEVAPADIVKCSRLITTRLVTGAQTTKENVESLPPNNAWLHTTPKCRMSCLPLSSDEKIDPPSFQDVEPSISNFIGELCENVTESIQEIRKATTLNRRNISLDHNEEIHSAELRRTNHLFEDNPITISDVSVYFHDQRSCTVNNCNTTNMSPIQEIKCKSFHNRYMNLTCESPFEDIDQTRISLVRTLSDEDDNESNVLPEDIDCDVACYELPDTCNQTQETVNNIDKCNEGLQLNLSPKQLKYNSSMCHKCKRCQITFMNESTTSTTNSFMLPTLPLAPNLDMNSLKRLRTHPHICDVNVLWQRSSLNRTIINLNNISDGITMSLGDNTYADSVEVTNIIREHKYDIERFIKGVNASKPIKFTFTKPFLFSHSNNIIRHSNWVLDFQMQYNDMLLFTHRKILTFSLVIGYEKVDTLDTELQLKSIKYVSNRVLQKKWEPIDFILDFQFKLNSPYDLLILCENGSQPRISRIIRQIDQICIDTILMGVQLQRIVFLHGSTIIRDENRTFVRKIVRKIVSSPGKMKCVEKVEFRIELLNIKKLCFKDITMPALYSFSQDIYLLPIGLTFLNKFLYDPLAYLEHVYR